MLSKEAVRILRPMTILFSGPMEAGKTYHLLRKVQSLLRTANPEPFDGRVCQSDDPNVENLFASAVFCKPAVDTRTEISSIASRNGSSVKGARALDSLDCVSAELKPNTLVAVDEAQFFDESLLRLHDCVQSMPGCTLIVAGLDRDFRREPFGHVLDLAERIVKGPGSGHVHMLRAPCYVADCEMPAAYTLRTVSDDSKILIGSSESYTPACPKHHTC